MGDINWLTAVTAAILAAGALLGYVNGLIKTILNLVLSMLTLILVLIFSPRVCAYLQTETELPDYVNRKAEAIVWEQMERQREESQRELILDSAEQQAIVDRLPFVPALKDSLLENDALQEYASQGIEAFAAQISRTVSEKIVTVVGYVGTFLAVFLLLRILVLALNVLGHLPLLHGINKLFGLLFGLAEGLLAVWIVGIILTAMGTTALGQSAARCIAESRFLTVLYGNNLLQQILFWSVG